MINIDSRISGWIVFTYDPMNLHLENIDVDYSKNNWGFYVYLYWNYPEAYSDSIANVTNISLYYSTGDRLVSTLLFESLILTNPGGIYLNGFQNKIYTTVTNLKANFAFSVLPTCMNQNNDALDVELKDM